MSEAALQIDYDYIAAQIADLNTVEQCRQYRQGLQQAWPDLRRNWQADNPEKELFSLLRMTDDQARVLCERQQSEAGEVDAQVEEPWADYIARVGVAVRRLTSVEQVDGFMRQLYDRDMPDERGLEIEGLLDARRAQIRDAEKRKRDAVEKARGEREFKKPTPPNPGPAGVVPERAQLILDAVAELGRDDVGAIVAYVRQQGEEITGQEVARVLAGKPEPDAPGPSVEAGAEPDPIKRVNAIAVELWLTSIACNPDLRACTPAAATLLPFLNYETRRTFVGQARLVAMSGMNRRMLQRSFRAMRLAGYLRVKRRMTSAGDADTNLMHICVPLSDEPKIRTALEKWPLDRDDKKKAATLRARNRALRLLLDASNLSPR